MSKREKYYGKEGFWIISVFGIMCIIFMTIYTMFIFKEVARKNMIFFGTVEKAMDYRTSANLVNLIFSSQNKSDLYYNGIQLMKKAGYEKLIVTCNGKEAWDKIQEFEKAGTLDENVHCVITDIEMPQMDGHRLTKLIKSDDKLKHLPVIIFSSLVNEEMRRKGESLGADAQLTKPEIGSLVDAIDELLAKRNK